MTVPHRCGHRPFWSGQSYNWYYPGDFRLWQRIKIASIFPSSLPKDPTSCQHWSGVVKAIHALGSLTLWISAPGLTICDLWQVILWTSLPHLWLDFNTSLWRRSAPDYSAGGVSVLRQSRASSYCNSSDTDMTCITDPLDWGEYLLGSSCPSPAPTVCLFVRSEMAEAIPVQNHLIWGGCVYGIISCKSLSSPGKNRSMWCT